MTGGWWQVWHGPHWLRVNERIKYVYVVFSNIYLHTGNSISVQVNEVIVNVILALCLFSVLLERQPAPWKSQIALFFMHRLVLWNQLGDSFRQHLEIQSPSPSILFTLASSLSSLSALSIARSMFHSRLNAYLFHKSSHAQAKKLQGNCSVAVARWSRSTKLTCVRPG